MLKMNDEERLNKSFRKTVFAKKSFGQNFLVDRNYISEIIAALDPVENENIIEIGPGRGALTEEILKSGANLTAIELDKDLIPVLQNQFSAFGNFRLVEHDALQIDYSRFKTESSDKKIKLAANLPYYISTAILQLLTQYTESFEFLVLMLQKEVVERVTAAPGNKERGYLTVLIEGFFDAKKLFDVPPNAFRPAPKIWSSIVFLKPNIKSGVLRNNPQLFKKIISTGFAQKRKTIYNNLKNAGEILYNKDLTEILLENQIDPMRRAETLSIDEWLSLTESFEKLK